MEGMVALVLLLTLLFGGMMLALVMGYRETEERRGLAAARALQAQRAAKAVTVPSFFATANSAAHAIGPSVTFEELLLSRLEQHVQAEHARVAEFVHFPSMDRLYRESESMLHVH